jgi:hypothetical protein
VATRALLWQKLSSERAHVTAIAVTLHSEGSSFGFNRDNGTAQYCSVKMLTGNPRQLARQILKCANA